MKTLMYASWIILCASIAQAQDLDKEIAKLDYTSSAAVMGQIAEQHTKAATAAIQKKQDELKKAGILIITKDTIIAVDKPLKIAFGWPVSAGMKSAGKKIAEREPFTITLYPAKDEKMVNAPQKWEVSYTKGTITAIP